jgi:hypothetical protein
MADDISHNAPTSTGTAPTSKRHKGGTPGQRTAPLLTSLHPAPRTNTRTGNRVAIPKNPSFTTTGKKADGGKS